MKKAIELLEEAKVEYLCVSAADEESEESLLEGHRLLKEAIAILKAPPRWETPEQ